MLQWLPAHDNERGACGPLFDPKPAEKSLDERGFPRAKPAYERENKSVFAGFLCARDPSSFSCPLSQLLAELFRLFRRKGLIGLRVISRHRG